MTADATSAPALSLTAEEQEWLEAHPVVRVGIDQGFAPFEFVDESGAYRGMAADYMALFSSMLGIRFEIAKGFNWNQTVDKAKRHELDLLSCVGITTERRQHFLYSKPYLSFPRVAFYRKGTTRPKSLDDLADKLIAVQIDSSHQGWLTENTAYRPILYPTAQEAMLALSSGEVEVFIGNLAASAYQIGELGIENLEVAFQLPGGTQELAIAVRKDWPLLVAILDKAISAIPERKILEIRQQWNTLRLQKGQGADSFKRNLSPEERRWLSDHQEITVRTMKDWPPMDFTSSRGQPVGIGVDLISLLGSRLGLKIHIETGSFTENLEAVKNTDADALMDVTPKTEREAYLAFSRPYLSIPHVIIARAGEAYFKDEEDLRGKTLALESGFGNIKYFQASYPDVKIVEYPDTEACLIAVSKGEADAYAGNRAVAGYIIIRDLLTGLQTQGQLRRPGSLLVVGVRKDWPILAALLDKALADLSVVEMQSILGRWVGFDGEGKAKITKLKLSQREKRFVAGHDPLVFSEVQWAPLSITTNPEHYDGMIADYFKIISERSGLSFTFQPSRTWFDVLEKYRAGEIDIIPAIGKDDAVKREILYSDPFVSFPLVIVTRDSVGYIKNTSELNGKTVAVGRGYTSFHFLKNNYPNIRLVETANVEDALVMVANSKVDAFVGHLAVAIDTMQKLGFKNLKIAG
ncbi:MAG: transporter substrate-binding domain-containing protein, partial [Desulfobulbus sp.]